MNPQVHSVTAITSGLSASRVDKAFPQFSFFPCSDLFCLPLRLARLEDQNHGCDKSKFELNPQRVSKMEN